MTEAKRYVLGLDIGATSIGWALVSLNPDDEPAGILKLGTHLFDAGVEGDIEHGRDQSRAVVRRQARAQRRQIWRRSWRRRNTLRLLQRCGLLPKFELHRPELIHEGLVRLDTRIRVARPGTGPGAEHTLPYRLRALALDGSIEPFELGRALYHLSQRRGFRSNRVDRAPREGNGREDSDEDLGKVKEGIRSLEAAITEAGARTLGEYLASLDPEHQRIRQRWTSRQMYEAEFNAIWSAQQRFHPAILTEELRRRLHHALFFQRPLKSAAHLIGPCDLHGSRKYPPRRAPMAARIAQEFRLLQTVNNLRLGGPNGRECELTMGEREEVLRALRQGGDLTFAAMRKMIDAPRGSKFNLERGGEKRACGNRTDALLANVWGPRWWNLEDSDRDAIVTEVLASTSERALATRAGAEWGLDKDAVAMLLELGLEPNYSAHCRKCLKKLVEAMRDGRTYAEAKSALFPTPRTQPADFLPPVNATLKGLRNPAVSRALTELRKLVNAIVRRYGKPDTIRVELARELRNSREHRRKLATRMRDREKERERAADGLKKWGIPEPTRSDIEKFLLYEECEHRCPYTGRSLSMLDLFGPAPTVDVEHIWPLSRSLDDSFLNKTLCDADENRAHKRNRTPHEAYHGTSQWQAITDRVRRFRSDAGRVKLVRFLQDELPADFASRQLQDTRIAAVFATEFLAALYGGRTDECGRLRIRTLTGGVTAHLRNEWNLNRVLGEGEGKQRSDHRHHAIDALVAALTWDGAIARLARAAEDAPAQRRRRFAPLPPPWPDFMGEVRTAVAEINVSHRPNRKLNGSLHADTIYGRAHSASERSGKAIRHVRKPLESLGEKSDLANIVDPRIRALVQQKLAQLGVPPARAFKDPKNLPLLVTRTGRAIPIKRVRIAITGTFRQVGSGPRARQVLPGPGSNHHACIVEIPASAGRASVRWEDRVVSRFDVFERLRRSEPVIVKHWPDGAVTKFTLMGNDFVVMPRVDGGRELMRVLSVSDGQIELIRHNDARPTKERRQKGQPVAGRRVITRGSDLLKRNAYKAHVGYLGEIIPMND